MKHLSQANDNQYDETKQNIWGPIILYSIFLGSTYALFDHTSQKDEVLYFKLSALLPMAIGSNAFAITYKYFKNDRVNKIIILHLFASFFFLAIAFINLVAKFAVLGLLLLYLRPWYIKPVFSVSLLVSLCLFLNFIILGPFFFNMAAYFFLDSTWVMAAIFIVGFILYKSKGKVKLGKRISPIISAPYRSLLRPSLIWGLFLVIILLISSIYEHGISLENNTASNSFTEELNADSENNGNNLLNSTFDKKEAQTN